MLIIVVLRNCYGPLTDNRVPDPVTMLTPVMVISESPSTVTEPAPIFAPLLLFTVLQLHCCPGRGLVITCQSYPELVVL